MTSRTSAAFIPFPPRIAALSAEAAGASWKAIKAKTRSDLPREYEVRMLAAFQMPDGKLRTAYDPYRPEYPADALPGLAHVRYTPRYSVNGYEGHDAQVLSFVPAREFLRPDNPLGAPSRRTDTLAIAVVENNGHSAFAWALDERQMAGWMENLPEGASVQRVSVTPHGMAGGENPVCAMMFAAAGARECHVGSSREALFEGLAGRFKFLHLEGMSPDDAETTILAHGQKCGWKLVTQLDTPVPDHPILRGPSHAVTALNGPLRDLLSIKRDPSSVLLPEPDEIRIAVISSATGAPPVLIYGFDMQSCLRRTALALADISGESLGEKKTSDPFADLHSDLDRIIEANPALSVTFTAGHAYVAPGAFPSQLLDCTDLAAGRKMAFGTATEESQMTLASLLLFAPDSDTAGIDDPDDIALGLVEGDNGWKLPEVSAMPVEAMAHRVEMMRFSLRHTPEPDVGM